MWKAEFPESLDSDSKGRVPRPRTRLGLGLDLEIQGCSRLGLGLGLVITFCAVLVSEWGHKLQLFKGEKGESDSKYRDSRLKTRLRLGLGLDIHQWSRLGIGIGLVFTSQAVSESKSGLENGDSGNSVVHH